MDKLGTTGLRSQHGYALVLCIRTGLRLKLDASNSVFLSSEGKVDYFIMQWQEWRRGSRRDLRERISVQQYLPFTFTSSRRTTITTRVYGDQTTTMRKKLLCLVMFGKNIKAGSRV